MTAECSLCGASAVERFGNGHLCESCIPDSEGDLSDSQTETGGANTSDSFSNESETADGEEAAERDARPGFDDGVVPIDPRSKRHVGSRDAEDCYAADDVFQAYLGAGHSYGVVYRGDVAALDEDEPDVLVDRVEALPETA